MEDHPKGNHSDKKVFFSFLKELLLKCSLLSEGIHRAGKQNCVSIFLMSLLLEWSPFERDAKTFSLRVLSLCGVFIHLSCGVFIHLSVIQQENAGIHCLSLTTLYIFLDKLENVSFCLAKK